MSITFTTPKLVIASFLLIWFGYFATTIGGTWMSANEWMPAYKFESTGNIYSSALQFSGSIIFIYLGLLEFIRYTQSSQKQYYTCIIIISISSIIWIGVSAVSGTEKTFIFHGPYFFLSCVSFFLGVRDDVWDAVVRFCMPMSVIYLGLVFWEIYQNPEIGIFFGWTPVMYYFTNAFWMIAITAMCSRTLTTNKAIILTVMMLMCVYICFLIPSRSWIVQCALLLIVTWKRATSQNRRQSLFVYAAAILFTVLVAYSAIRYFGISTTYIVDKLFADTRSQQYITFFSQISPTDLFLGKGGQSSYVMDGNAEQYLYFDNQFINTSFHWGVFITVGYSALVFLPGILLFTTKRFVHYRWDALVLMLWFLALMGLSVYNGLFWDIKNLLIIMTAGHCFRMSMILPVIHPAYMSNRKVCRNSKD